MGDNAINNNDSTIDSALIKVEVLEKEYEVTLTQYQEALNNYIDILQQGDSTTVNTIYSEFSGRAWWGSSGLKEGPAETQEDCENMCSSVDNCSGATFNPVKKYCWARGGEGNLNVSTENDIALIPQQKASLTVLSGLNSRLLSLNDKIQSELKNINPDVQQIKIEQKQKEKDLDSYYNKLLIQKIEIDRQLQEYYSLEESYQDEHLQVDKENISYRFWMLLTLIIVVICIKQMMGPSIPPTMNMLFWITIIILLVILTFNISIPQGFVVWAILVLIVVLMKSGQIVSP